MNEMLLRSIKRLLAPLQRRVHNLVQTTVLKSLKQIDGRVFVELCGLSGQTYDAEMLQPYGLATHPKKEADTIVLALNGDSTHSLAIVIGDSKHRLDVAEGEVALYTDEGAKLHLKNNKIIDIEADAINLLGPVTCTDDLTVNKSITCVKTITAQQDAIIANISFTAHTHIASGPGSPTAPPA